MTTFYFDRAQFALGSRWRPHSPHRLDRQITGYHYLGRLLRTKTVGSDGRLAAQALTIHPRVLAAEYDRVTEDTHAL
jgi:hypothetical protein